MNASVLSLHPVTLPASADRDRDLTLRISAPTVGDRLPVVVLSHGYGSSSQAYGPLTDYWAAHGFVVIQPTHLDSRTLGLADDDERRPRLLDLRVEDMTNVLDHLPTVIDALPGVAVRTDPTRIAVAGHSFGGQTAGVLLGARVIDEVDGSRWGTRDPRITAGILLATAGTGGADLTPFAAKHFPYMNPDFDEMTTPTLVVAGDADDSPLSTRGPDWSSDPYRFGPGATSLLTLFGAEHSLGGIPGYEAAETTDESPARVEVVQRVTTAFLHSTLGGDDSWPSIEDGFTEGRSALGRIESK